MSRTYGKTNIINLKQILRLERTKEPFKHLLDVKTSGRLTFAILPAFY